MPGMFGYRTYWGLLAVVYCGCYGGVAVLAVQPLHPQAIDVPVSNDQMSVLASVAAGVRRVVAAVLRSAWTHMHAAWPPMWATGWYGRHRHSSGQCTACGRSWRLGRLLGMLCCCTQPGARMARMARMVSAGMAALACVRGEWARHSLY